MVAQAQNRVRSVRCVPGRLEPVDRDSNPLPAMWLTFTFDDDTAHTVCLVDHPEQLCLTADTKSALVGDKRLRWLRGVPDVLEIHDKDNATAALKLQIGGGQAGALFDRILDAVLTNKLQ